MRATEMGQPVEESVIVAFGEGDIRLGHLAIHARHGNNDRAIIADPLYARLTSAENVLRGRKEVAAAEAALLDPKAPPAYSGPYKPGTVPVRLRVSEIQQLIEGLKLFLLRPNPALDVRGRPIDPPESVRPLLERLQGALKASETRVNIARRERELLA